MCGILKSTAVVCSVINIIFYFFVSFKTKVVKGNTCFYFEIEGVLVDLYSFGIFNP